MLLNDYTLTEALEIIGEDANIDTKDWFGKYLVLGLVLADMNPEDADKLLMDQFSMIEEELNITFEEAYDSLIEQNYIDIEAEEAA